MANRAEKELGCDRPLLLVSGQKRIVRLRPDCGHNGAVLDLDATIGIRDMVRRGRFWGIPLAKVGGCFGSAQVRILPSGHPTIWVLSARLRTFEAVERNVSTQPSLRAGAEPAT